MSGLLEESHLNVPETAAPRARAQPHSHLHMPAALRGSVSAARGQGPPHSHTDPCLWLADLCSGQQRAGQEQALPTPRTDTLPSSRNPTVGRQPWNHHGPKTSVKGAGFLGCETNLQHSTVASCSTNWISSYSRVEHKMIELRPKK